MSERRYISTDEATLHIGQFWIDDARGIELMVSDPKEPLYGYADPQFTTVARGQTIVHGALDINFRMKGYLFLALSRLESIDAIAASVGDVSEDPVRKILYALQNRNELGDLGLDPAALSKEQRQTLLERPFEAFDLKGFKRIGDALKADIWRREEVLAPSLVELAQSVRPRAARFSDPFELKIVYDRVDPSDVLASQDHVLVERVLDIHFVGQSKIIMNNVPGGGEPLVERYQFIARDVV